jgi:hypothetical protein
MFQKQEALLYRFVKTYHVLKMERQKKTIKAFSIPIFL